MKTNPSLPLFAALVLGAVVTPPLSAAVPAMTSYQGRVAVSGAPFTGLGLFRFALINKVDGSSLWSNDATSVAGSEPTDAVTLVVRDGLFTVLLGDTALGNMGALPADLFALNSDVCLRVWFDDGVNGSSQLTPDTRLSSVPYALAAEVRPGSLTADQLNSGGIPPMPGQFLSYDGGSFRWTDPEVAVGAIWSKNGANAYYNAGNIGIGLTDPAHRLTVRTPSNDYGIEHTDGTVRLSTYLGGSTGGGWLGTISNHKLSFFVNDGTASMTVDTTGNVGIGTAAPAAKLDVVSGSGDLFHLVGYEPFLTLYDSNHGYRRNAIQSVNGGMNLFTDSYLRGANGFAFLRLDDNGNVGIGSATPVGKLEVVAQDALRLIGYQPFLTLFDSNAGYARSRIQGVNGDIVLAPESYLNGSNPNAAVVIANSGNVSVRTLTIRGGADLAEPFELSATDIPKGSVVVIDEKHPGKLKLSTAAYDTRVAGIVSGANGVNPGISLQQDGVLEGGQNVALSGRVYVQADASPGAIQPGDLLTTSATPGHAMKVLEPAKAQGAILGKAMSGLGDGKGMVLVLVTLQ